MKLFAIVLCLLSERYLIHRFSYTRFYWFPEYLHKMSGLAVFKTLYNHRWALLFLLILPLVLITAFIFFIFAPWLYGFVGFLLNLAVFYYCLGPINSFYPLHAEGLDDESQVGHYFYQVNRQLFTPILCFMVLGPVGLVFYRLLTLCQNFQPVMQEAKTATDIIEWIPIRITAFLSMIVGNFQQGLVPFKRLFFSNIDNNYAMLRATALEALLSNKDEIISVPLAEKAVEHALIVLLVIVAIGTHIA